MNTETNILTDDDSWTMVIRPQRAWWDLRLMEVWNARELILLFVWRDLVSIYKQTVIGPLWYFLHPTLQTLMYFFIFGVIARLPTDGIPPLLFYLSGTILWALFSTTLSGVATTFIGNAYLYGKVYFHRLAIPISVVISNFVNFLIQSALLLIVMLIYNLAGFGIHPNRWLFLLPLLLLIIASLGLSSGIIISALTVRYRDLQHFIPIGVQFLLYATPIIYPLSAIPEGWRSVIQFNPLTPVVEAFRFGLLGQGSVNPPMLVYSIFFTIIVFFISLLAFNRAEGTFMDFV